MNDDEWKAAFAIIQQAEQLAAPDRLEFASNRVSDPAMRDFILELLDGEDSSDPADRQVASGTRFGGYEILEKLGKGGMGRVYAARHMESGQQVALKFLVPELIAQSRSVRRLIKEAQAASALNHPNIVRVYGLIREDQDTAIAMELVDGESLRQRCGVPQEPAAVAHWGSQTAGALAAAHQNQIIHCDIKPENLMLARDGHVKLVDFGLARHLFSGASTESIAAAGGTVAYFAPEQVAGKRPVSASDIFALGTVLYELAAGKHPFRGETPFDTLHAIAKERPKPLSAYNSNVSERLDRFILRMLEKNPDRRPSAAESAEALNAFTGPAASGDSGRRRLRALFR